MGHFLTRSPVEVAMLASTHPLYRVLKPVVWQPSEVVEYITVREGFICDGTSIPRLLRGILTFHHTQKAAILHDWLYTHQSNRTRAWVDRQFFEAMCDTDVNPIKARAFYYGVRIGGWVPWSKWRRVQRAAAGSTS